MSPVIEIVDHWRKHLGHNVGNNHVTDASISIKFPVKIRKIQARSSSRSRLGPSVRMDSYILKLAKKPTQDELEQYLNEQGTDKVSVDFTDST